MRCILKTVLMILTMTIAMPWMQATAKEPIKVVIDQESLVLDQPPTLEEGRVFLPLRGIFEALGAEVEWDEKSQSVTGKKDNKIVKLEIGKRQASVNNEKVLMDVAGKMINGRTMVPVRFIAENLGVKVDWDAKRQLVIITTTTQPRDSAIYRTTNFNDDYVEMKITQNSIFEITGKTLSNNQYVLVEITDMKGKEVSNNLSEIKTGGTFKQIYDLNLANGKYIINIFMNDKEYGTYKGTDTGIIISQSKGEVVFEKSPIYQNNIQYLSKGNKVSSSDLNLHSFSEENKARLSKLARSIAENQSTDYHKTLAIANWVSDNIYYDLGAAQTGIFGKTDAIGTLDERRSICQGYAALTTGLLRSIGIPTKLVFGYALGIDSDSVNWEEVDHTRPNHVWNEVFIDDKWIIVDTTWNSKNTYVGGEYIEADKIYSYFDPTIEAFSNTHKITNR